MHIHFITAENITVLEGIFAYLTPDGWIIPEWIKNLTPYNV